MFLQGLDFIKTAKTALICALIVGFFASEVMLLVGLSAWSQNRVLNKHLVEVECEVKEMEVQVKKKALKNEQLRQDLETIRLQAFMKAYERSEYIIETKK